MSTPENSVFADRVAIVTGAGCGIGFGIASALAASGARVLINDENPQRAARAEAALRARFSASCQAVCGDIGQAETVDSLVDTAVSQFGSIDLVVANAGLTLAESFETFPRTAFDRLLQTNLAGSFFLLQKAAAHMRQQNQGGSILLLSSVLGHRACAGHTAYAMTKAALEMMARSLVLELSPHGININSVAPGATCTERTESDPAYAEKWSRVTPMQRAATPEDIASAALFLLSPAARHITGQNLIVDGGWTACSPLPEEWPAAESCT